MPPAAMLAAIAAFGLLAAGTGSPPSAAHAVERGAPPVVSVVPRPREERIDAGTYAWPARVRIGLDGPAARNVAEQLRAYLRENGVWATISERTARADVVLRAAAGSDARLGGEGYVLNVRRGGVTVRANAAPGLFYALQTLRQISSRPANGLRSRAVTIVDRPEYRWRGIHLDVARHYFPVPVVERYIDVAAHYKLNVFHWHLTDDQGWRLENPRYPALTAGREHYSAADVRAVVAYAAARYVTVVPEIDLPAHAGAVLRAYPRLGCGRDALCTSGAGLAFARDVLGGALDDFPTSPYVHAGGDEVPAPFAAAQPAFTRELARYAESRGRRLVGWDEILTARLSGRAVVMVWTSRARAARAARRGNDVVITSAPLYFDASQGDPAQEPRASAHMSTLEQVYDDAVMPPGLAPRDAVHVLGAQANVWTEHIATPEHLFYMALPRELALAEAVWTPRARKSWPSFLTRLPAQFAWLEANGYTFRIPNTTFALTGGPAVFGAVPGHVQTVRAWTTATALTVTLTVPLNGATIRYTTDGTVPTAASRAYTAPFTVKTSRRPLRMRAAAFLRNRSGAVTECILSRTQTSELPTTHAFSRTWAALVSP